MQVVDSVDAHVRLPRVIDSVEATFSLAETENQRYSIDPKIPDSIFFGLLILINAIGEFFFRADEDKNVSVQRLWNVIWQGSSEEKKNYYQFACREMQQSRTTFFELCIKV